jgi:hypothetical protein
MLRRLLVWALVTQPIYAALTAEMGVRLNVLFSLAAGAALVILLRQRRHIWVGVAAAALIAVNQFLDGGAPAPLALAAAYACRRRPPVMMVLVTLAAAINAWVKTPEVPGAWVTVWIAPLLLVASPRVAALLPRAPRWAFYAFYPAHLAVIWLVAGPYV